MGVKCSSEGSVVEISWITFTLNIIGSIDFKRVPPNINRISFLYEELRSKVQTSLLPHSLTYICIEGCSFTGTLNMGALAPRMQSFYCCGNLISKVTSPRNLPVSLLVLQISESNLSHKAIEIGKLPNSDIAVDLRRSGFTEVMCEDPSDADRVRLVIYRITSNK